MPIVATSMVEIRSDFGQPLRDLKHENVKMFPESLSIDLGEPQDRAKAKVKPSAALAVTLFSFTLLQQLRSSRHLAASFLAS